MTRSLSALVIGNARYPGASLRNPTNDAHDVANKLGSCGFAVTTVVDASYADMDRALKKFRTTMHDQQVGLFFFAGHGVQIEGENYLAAIDTDFSDEITTKHSSLPLNRVIETMEKAGPSTSVIVLDACRDNPWERAWHRSAATRGLATVYAPKGTLIAFATSPGQVASDGSGRNGAYTASLLKHIDVPDCSIESMFKRVRNTLSVTTNGKQISWEHTSLSGEFYFNLSLGARITDYSSNALSDKLYVLDEARESHRIIKGLKSHTWGRQNDAVAAFDAADANKFDLDSLFVIGRNIYQSACGSSNSAIGFIRNFMSHSAPLNPERRKALLDGMLFEVFFDSKGQLRDEPKSNFYTTLAELQMYPELAASFDFIAECLLPYASRFHVLPGKQHAVAVDVQINAEQEITGVFLAGQNVLRAEADDFAPGPNYLWRTEARSKDELEELLARQMTIPRHLLALTISGGNPEGFVKFPRGYTTQRE